MSIIHTKLRKLITFPSSEETYRLCVHEQLSLINVSSRVPGPHPGFTGNEGPLLQLIIDNLGVNFDIFIADDHGYGLRDENNTWTGCQGMIQKKEVDVAMAATKQNYWTFQFAYPSFMYREESVHFVSKWPDLVDKPYVIFQPFEIEVWISILATLLILALVSYFIMGRKDSFENQLFSRFSELLLQEPSVKIKKIASQKILALAWSIGIQLLTLSYKVLILIIIMLPKTEPPIDNAERVLQVLRSGTYKVALPKEAIHVLNELLTYTNPIFREIGEIIRDYNWLFEINKSNFGEYLRKNFIIISSTIRYKRSNPLGIPIVISDDYIYFGRPCVLTRKDFPLKSKLDNVLMRIFEAGLFQKLFEHDVFRSRLKEDLQSAPQEEDTDFKVLTMENLQSAFYVFVLGHFTAFIVLLIEILTYKCKKNRKKSVKTTEQNVIK